MHGGSFRRVVLATLGLATLALEPARAAMVDGRAWWASLGSPRYVAAPMVDQSELAFRLLARRHGAQLAYTPMLLAKLFATVPQYRKDHFSTCDADRPLIAQLAGHDPDVMLRAASHLEPHVDGVDVNLGCPQQIARRGRYGAFLLPDVPRVCEIVRTLSTGLSVPVSVKVRLLGSTAETVQACARFEEAGAAMVCVHGRRREQKKQFCGAAEWEPIGAVVSALSVPVLANGGVAHLDDVSRCLQATGAAGVMSSEALLANPALFSRNREGGTGAYLTQRRLAREYLELAREHGASPSCARSHLFKLLHGACAARPREVRDALAAAADLRALEAVVGALDEIDPGLELEPFPHAADGREPRAELDWYHRHRQPAPGAAAGSAAERAAAVEAAAQERLARRALKAQNKAHMRERALARREAVAAAASSPSAR